MPSELVQAFVVALPTASRQRFEAWAELPDVLQRLVATARAAWPSFGISATGFIAHVARQVDPDAQPGTLAELRIVDLWLAFACVQGDTSALAQLERDHFQRLEPVLARVAPEDADSVLAELRENLLLPRRHGRGLESYAGRGDLWTWLRISAVRSAVRTQRSSQRRSMLEQQELRVLGTTDALGLAPEAEHERERFVAEVQRAVEAAFGELPPRDKTLLMQHYVDGLSTIQLGRLHAVHRVSVSRRLIRARRRLLASARAYLVERLALTASECDSVLRLVRSQLDITLKRVLA
ncbi:MAG: hypothetical protein KUG77_21595 [Nannocystaceae bacterium]|nr:hypothetical protein [Nannocystaceae bacterium]